MKLLNFLLLILLSIVAGCSENDDAQPLSEPIEFLTVEVSPDHSTGEELFVFVTDNSGKILDGQSVKSGSTANLKTISPPDEVNLTICYPSPSFYTIAGLHKGEKIRIDDSNDNVLPPVSGAANINIQNCAGAFFNLSDGILFSQASGQGNSSIDATFELRQPSSRILVSSRNAVNEPVYTWVDNVINGGSYSIDYNNLTVYPKTVDVSFAEYVSISITAGKTVGTGFGYMMTNGGVSRNPEDPEPTSVAAFGYLDGYDDYIMSASATTNTLPDYYRVANVHRFGSSLPEAISFPTNTLSVENASIADFRFTYSSTFTFSIHQWRQETSSGIFSWTVYSDSPSVPSIKELPEEMVSKYPWISLSDLEYFKSDFRKSEDGYTYRQFIQNTFENNDDSQHSYSTDSFQVK